MVVLLHTGKTGKPMKWYLFVLSAVMAGIVIGYMVVDKKESPISPEQVLHVTETTSVGAATAIIPAHIKNILPPPGFVISDVPANRFGQWLQQLPLRKDNTVYLFDGSRKKNQSLHYAVLDVPYNRNPLQQCADAIIRLRAEYIFETKAEQSIRFFHQGNSWFTCPATCTRPQLETFLNTVFTWCGSYNLQAQLKPVATIRTIQTGDVFVHGGSPGHAMLVAAVAQNDRGEKVFLLLQSFMPAQDIHIVINPYDPQLSPWYSIAAATIATPGWTFTHRICEGGNFSYREKKQRRNTIIFSCFFIL